MKTKSKKGYLFVNLCNRVGHKRYQNIFEDVQEGLTYIYETDDPSIKDGIADIQNDCNENSYTNESVELTFEGDEPTDEDFNRYYNAKINMMLAAEKAMINEIKNYGIKIEE